MFVDSVTLTLAAGKGGNGAIAWRRAKFIPKGGPTGGDGGRGGSVFLQTDNQIVSLQDYRNKRLLSAKSGAMGGSNLCHGKSGSDLTLKVPCGTIIRDKQTGVVLFDLIEHGQKICICKGGKGGKGNHHFKSSTNQAPYICTPGTPGESKEIELELKLIADIGLVGMPNAGKSTLISHICHRPVKIGAYPFTTLSPNLGYLQYHNGHKLLMADIPGIIENAHANKGLGLHFLKHIERTSILLFVIDVSGWEQRDPVEDFHILQKEILAYNATILQKPYLILLNKIDREEAQEHVQRFYQQVPVNPAHIIPISAQDRIGLDVLRSAIQTLTLPSLNTNGLISQGQ